MLHAIFKRTSRRVPSAIVAFAAPAGLLLGCAASYPAPTQRMADAQAATRSAQEMGAGSQPAAELHLRLAQEQIAAAKQAIDASDNQRATFLLTRAQADAELALALAREHGARMEAQRAIDQANTMRLMNGGHQ